MTVLGWDIGGVNLKAALVVDGEVRTVRSRPFELQRSPERLAAMLREIADDCRRSAALDVDVAAHAVTMTAELSQMFRTKREGVAFVLEAVRAALPAASIHVYTTAGRFVLPDDACNQPLTVAAANWAATARMVARHHPDALLVDVGSTTADLIPIVGGSLCATGWTDLQRLSSGELVYTGVIRTPIEAIVADVPVLGGRARVSAEGFALSGDVHLWLESLAPADYEAPTPDGRPATREFARERLARVVCADREMLDDEAITRIATAVATAQVEQIAAAMREVRRSHPSLRVAVVTGLGAAIGTAAAARVGLRVVALSDCLGAAGARCAPATAVALLLEAEIAASRRHGLPLRQPTGEPQVSARGNSHGPPVREASGGLIVVKLGGAIIAAPDEWRLAVAALRRTAGALRVLVVPGGGPFADAVRMVDARFRLGDEAAHWMAIGGMDQHAEMIAGTMPGFTLVRDAGAIAAAFDRGAVPVLAPSSWLRSDDPLPHSWEVTSDSIAAWIAGRLDASRLLLVKPAGAEGLLSVDRYFPRALPSGLAWATCDPRALEARLQAPVPSAG